MTNGCTEAIQLALRALTRPGDVLLVEAPSYYGFLETAESLGLRVVEVPTDPETGVSLDHLEAAIRRTRPARFSHQPDVPQSAWVLGPGRPEAGAARRCWAAMEWR